MRYARDAESRAVIELFLATDSIARPIIGGPNLPADRVAALRAAFDATMRDDAFQAEAKRASIDVSPTGGVEAEARLMKILGAPSAVIAEARQFGEAQ